MSPTHKRIFPKFKHKNDKYGNIANVGNLRKTLLLHKGFKCLDTSSVSLAQWQSSGLINQR